jgi:hypothetical protein
MKERRFLKVIKIGFVLGIWFLIILHIPVHAQPIPVTSNISAVYSNPFNPFTTTTLNSSTYFDFLSSYVANERIDTTPFDSLATFNMMYSDIMTNAMSQNLAYTNLLGMNYQEGRSIYNNPATAATGQYRNFISPVGGFSSDTAFTATPGGVSTHVARELIMPWFYYGTAMDAAQGVNIAPSLTGAVPVVTSGTNVSHASFGLPMPADLTGMGNYLRGVAALETYGQEASAMNRAWGWDYAYTKEMMPFVPNFAYYNEANPTGWYFPADVSNIQSVAEAGPGLVTGYTLVNEAPETLAAGAGLLGLAGLGGGIPIGLPIPPGSGVGGLIGGGPLFFGAPFLFGGLPLFGASPLLGIGAGPGAAFGIGGGAAPLLGIGVGPGAAFGIGGGAAPVSGFISGTGISYGGVPGLGW